MQDFAARISRLAQQASSLDERLSKVMRSRGIDGDGDGIYNEGVTPPAKPPRKGPAKRPTKAPQREAQSGEGTPAPKPQRARRAPVKAPIADQAANLEA